MFFLINFKRFFFFLIKIYLGVLCACILFFLSVVNGSALSGLYRGYCYSLSYILFRAKKQIGREVFSGLPSLSA